MTLQLFIQNSCNSQKQEQCYKETKKTQYPYNNKLGNNKRKPLPNINFKKFNSRFNIPGEGIDEFV